MGLIHQLLLYGLLGWLGISLLYPGVAGIFRPEGGPGGLFARDTDARNHLRALNGMMAALGAVSVAACRNLEAARPVVLTLGVVMAFLVAARLTALAVDGLPRPKTLLYLAVEALMACVFLGWPPPGTGGRP